ncbi:MAG TPA: pyroglutamyl-peptidase I [Polyangia bacterium]|jgi:pyroglutamyl-peptidase
MSRRRVIIAPFEPFAGRRRNRARDAAHLLAGHEVGGAPVEIVDLPVVYAAIPSAIRGLFARDPALVVLVGESAETRKLLVERLAVNVAHAPIHDNAGARPIDDELVPGGETARRVPFDPRTAVNAAIAAGCPADVSSHAGTFLCNAALYHALGQAAERPAPPRVAFVHVPARFPWARDHRAARGIYAIAKHLVPALT